MILCIITLVNCILFHSERMGSWLSVGEAVFGCTANGISKIARSASPMISSVDEGSVLSSDVVSADSSVATVESVPRRSLQEFLNDLGV